MIRMLVLQNGGTSEDAHDIFQDSLIIMLETIDDGKFVLTCKFKTYFYCVCENLWKQVLHKRRVAANYLVRKESDDPESDISEAMDHSIYEEIFREVFESMDQVSKDILNLYWQDVSPQEIAAKLGYTYGYVRKKKCDAQNELTEKVKNHPGYRKIIETEHAIKEIVR